MQINNVEEEGGGLYEITLIFFVKKCILSPGGQVRECRRTGFNLIV